MNEYPVHRGYLLGVTDDVVDVVTVITVVGITVVVVVDGLIVVMIDVAATAFWMAAVCAGTAAITAL